MKQCRLCGRKLVYEFCKCDELFDRFLEDLK